MSQINKENKSSSNDIKIAAAIGAVILIICVVFFALRNTGKSDTDSMAAVVSTGSDIYGVFLLKNYTDSTEHVYSMESDGKPVHFVIKDGGISFYDVECPDKICEKSGVLSQENDTAVCMPNRVSVRITPENELNDEMRSKIIELS